MKYFDYNVAIKYSVNDTIFRKLCVNYLRKYEELTNRLQNAMIEGPEKFRDEIHSINGITLNLGGVALYEITHDLERTYLDKETLTDNDYRRYMHIFQVTYHHILAYLGGD